MDNSTKGKWEAYESPFAPAVVIKQGWNRRQIIAICRLEIGSEDMAEATANAHLIAAAVNACREINPDNPMAAAEATKDMHEVLNRFKALVQGGNTKVLSKGLPDQIATEAVLEQMEQALDKADGKEEPE